MAETRIEQQVGDVSPVVTGNKEPALLVAATGSMTQSNEDGFNQSRKVVLGDAITQILDGLAARKQASPDQAAGAGTTDGLLTVTCTGGQAQSLGMLTPENHRQQWQQVTWTGEAEILPGLRLLTEAFEQEFGNVPEIDQPKMLALIITDSEALDSASFINEITKAEVSDTYVCIAVMGTGTEHDTVLSRYQEVAKHNDHVRVVDFGNTSSSATIAEATLSLLS